MEYFTKNRKETDILGATLAREIIKSKSKKALILALEGELGSGKTTFIQGFAKGLGIKRRILSPSFLILRLYSLKNFNFYHLDCYRIKKTKEILDLGFKEIIKEKKVVVVIEWADKIYQILPKNIIEIKFKWLGENERKIIIK